MPRTGTQTIPLSEALPDLPQPNYVTNKDKHDTRVTILENGMKVASENRYGKFCTVGGKLYLCSEKKILALMVGSYQTH